MDVKKRDFLAAGVGLGMGLASSKAMAQQAAPAAPAAATQQPRYVWSGKQPATVDTDYKPRRLNKCIELWEDGQPMYYVSWGPSGMNDGYEQGKKMAQTWADCICIDLEHACFDLGEVRNFMRGLVDGGPTRSGHRTPATFCPMPVLGLSKDYMEANSWMVAQILATGVMGVNVCHARDPKAVAAAVQAMRYPFPYPVSAKKAFSGLPYEGEGLRGSGSQGFAAQIWGVNPNRYVRLADVWPMNSQGELMLGLKIEDKWALDNVEKTFAVPGIAFAEWGPGDMAMSLNGLSFFPDPPVPRTTEYSVPTSIAPNVQAARLRVAAACRSSGVGLLDTAIPETVIDSIRLGAKVIECAERSALIGREYTKRKMPV
jgi:4-hydroxy-2-oxoheptanedioate aldolase